MVSKFSRAVALKALLPVLFFSFLQSLANVYSGSAFPLSLKTLDTTDGLPDNDVRKVYQDKEGYIWIASSQGLSQYNGYTVKTYKSDLSHGDLLNSNSIHCLVEDFHFRLWIGTNNGLNVLDKVTGKFRQINQPAISNTLISSIVVTKNGRLFLGTDRGLFQYIYEKDTCLAYNRANTGNVLPQTTIKSLLEDSRGDLWIGTWNEGLYRYETETGKYYAYPRMNPRNSAHVIFEDSKKRIWVGTWAGGLYLLENIYDPPYTTWKQFKHDANDPNSIMDNIIYDISEDMSNNSLWVGNRSGLSVLPFNSSSFINYYPDDMGRSISGNEVNSLMRDKQGIMWIGMLGAGVNFVDTRKPVFKLDKLDEIKQELNSNSVRSIFVDSDDRIWLGIGSYGLVLKDRKTGKSTYYLDDNEFSSFLVPTVLTFMESPKTGKIWLGTHDGGVFVYDKSAPKGRRVKNYTTENTTWLSYSRINAIVEDRQGNTWMGTEFGLSMLAADGTGISFDSLSFSGKELKSSNITAITTNDAGEIWAAMGSNGVLRITGGGNRAAGYTFEHFPVQTEKLSKFNILCISRDIYDSIWIGTEGCGLFKFDEKEGKFVSVHRNWNLPGDIIFSILDDKSGNLWIATNAGLLKLNVSDKSGKPVYRLYTTADGLQNNIFNKNSAYTSKTGELFFGGHQGYNYFFPERLTEQNGTSQVVITDIKIFDQSWEAFDDKLKNKISRQSPEFTKQIKLDYQHNNFSIEFSALEYFNSAQSKYAYKLDGFDSDWIHTDASRRFAYYNNLPSGTYTFQLKSTNSNGIWSEEITPLKVVILPPPWKSWWAYLTYSIALILIGVLVYRVARNRLILQNALRLRKLEQEKLIELNHAKLQFFTNITHELLTPLTIISAAVDEMKISAPQNEKNYQIMTSNINRLIRLLQQILEFRKAETGNLKLKVSKGDLALFIQNEVESFRPLMKKKRLHFSVVANPEPFLTYFDPDKMDKIIYNLLSNAAKYNNSGGTVWIDLSLDESGFYAVLSVKDNGKGISKEALSTLFQRFYEGDYRKFNTIGTGIGLSLTKDLVELHGGSITVESEVNKGTCFKVLIPVKREAYKEMEIDDETIIPPAPIVQDEDEPAKHDPHAKKYTLLLLEDNEELLNLMVKLLDIDYNVHTGITGIEGIEILENEEIDLIVSDIMMPEMDGIEFCQTVKNNFDICHIPIILLTAKNSEEDQVDAYDSGADAFITKPFNLSVLYSRISNLLKARERDMRDFKTQMVYKANDLNYTSIDEEFIQRAIQCVHNHLDEPAYDHRQFLGELGASRSTSHRKLKSLTGLNTSAFIRNVRLKAACQIMEEKKSIRISELAYAVGFNDPKYFSVCFKKEFGIQPSEYIARFVTNDDSTCNLP